MSSAKLPRCIGSMPLNWLYLKPTDFLKLATGLAAA
jgi:hypothetical protein